jgi:hypothetical protein
MSVVAGATGPPEPPSVRTVSRQLWNLIEPIASSVYFVPEVHERYEALGLPPWGAGYFCSRAACMGEVPGPVVAATFAVFDPAIVMPAVEEGWAKTTAPALTAARLDGQRAALSRMVDAKWLDPERQGRATELMVRAADAAAWTGRPLFAGLRSLPALAVDDDPIGAFWRAADVLREHRGDSHVLAWSAMHVDPVEITLLTELWWGQRVGGYVRTRGWSPDTIEAGIESLRRRGFVDGTPPAFTEAGEQLRTVIEELTDQGQTEVVAALGDDADELFDLLAPVTDAVLAAKGYPRDPAALGRL